MSMKISFGAKLITKPEECFFKTDTLDEQKKIKRFVRGLKMLVEHPVIDKTSSNDIIELRRAANKKGNIFYIDYYSPEIKNVQGFQNIHYEIKDFSIENIILLFKQITLPMMYKKGCFSKDINLCTRYEDDFLKTFGVNYNDFFKNL